MVVEGGTEGGTTEVTKEPGFMISNRIKMSEEEEAYDRKEIALAIQLIIFKFILLGTYFSLIVEILPLLSKAI